MQKIVVITGASSGIGLRLAERYASRGDRVYNLSRGGANIKRVVDLQTDVTDPDSLTSSVRAVLDRESRIDVAIYCAGFSIAGSVLEVPFEKAQRLFETNVFGAMLMTKLVANSMKERKRGAICLVGSIAGLVPLPFEAYYSASKAALAAFGKTAREELNQYGVSLVCFEPGGTATPFSRHRDIVRGEHTDLNLESAVRAITDIEQGGLTADRVARAVVAVLDRKGVLPPSVTVGASNHLVKLAVRLLPSRLVSFAVRKKFGQEKSSTVLKDFDARKREALRRAAAEREASHDYSAPRHDTAIASKYASQHHTAPAAHVAQDAESTYYHDSASDMSHSYAQHATTDQHHTAPAAHVAQDVANTAHSPYGTKVVAAPESLRPAAPEALHPVSPTANADSYTQ